MTVQPRIITVRRRERLFYSPPGRRAQAAMTLATVSLLAAPIARLPFEFMKAGPPAFFGVADLFIVAMLVYDLVTRKRVHPATIWGGLLILVSQPLRLMLAGTSTWMAIASWLTS